jgi:argininosuccinate lyase
VDTATFDVDRMASAADSGDVVAIDLADWLVLNGTPFRDAHGLVASMVRDATSSGTPLSEIAVAGLGPDVAPLFRPDHAADRQSIPGGAGAEAVATQLRRFDERLAGDEERLNGAT